MSGHLFYRKHISYIAIDILEQYRVVLQNNSFHALLIIVCANVEKCLFQLQYGLLLIQFWLPKMNYQFDPQKCQNRQYAANQSYHEVFLCDLSSS